MTRTLLICLMTALLLCSALPLSAAPVEGSAPLSGVARDQQQELDQARSLLEAGRSDDALMLLRGFVIRYPDSPLVAKANLWLARLFFDRGQDQEARLYLDRIPEHNQPEVLLLDGVLKIRAGDAAAGVPLLRDLPADSLAPADQRLREQQLAAGNAALGQPLQALVYDDRLSQAQDPAVVKQALQQAHDLLAGFDDASLAEAVFMFKGQAVGQEAALIQARRLMAAGQTDAALALVKRIVLDPTPFPHRSEAAALLDRLTGRPWLQRAIGVLLPLSGRYAAFGNLVKRGMELAAELHDRSRKPVRFIYRDVGKGAEQAAQEVSRLANEDRVMALAGPITGVAAEAAAERAEQEQVPLISLSQREGLPEIGRYIFRDSLTNRLQAQALAHYAVKERGMTSFGVLYPENRLGRELAQMFSEEVLKLGGLVTVEASYSEDATDFRRQIRELMGEDPNAPAEPPPMTEQEQLDDLFQPDFPAVDFDALFIPDYADKIGLIAPQLPFYGIEGVPLLGINGWNSPELLRNAGDSVEGAVFVDGFFRYSPYPFVKEFVDLYTEKFGEEPSILEAQGFDVANILLAQLDRPEVQNRDTLRLVLSLLRDYPGVTGATSFDLQGEAQKVLFLLQVQHGNIVQIN